MAVSPAQIAALVEQNAALLAMLTGESTTAAPAADEDDAPKTRGVKPENADKPVSSGQIGALYVVSQNDGTCDGKPLTLEVTVKVNGKVIKKGRAGDILEQNSHLLKRRESRR